MRKATWQVRRSGVRKGSPEAVRVADLSEEEGKRRRKTRRRVRGSGREKEGQETEEEERAKEGPGGPGQQGGAVVPVRT